MLTCTPAHSYSPFIVFLLSTFSSSFWVVFSLVSHFSVILLVSFSQSSHSFMPVHFSVLALFHNNSPLSSCRHYCPHSNLISLTHTLRSLAHTFFPVPLLFSHHFVCPHCLIPSFFLSSLILPLWATLKRHACSVVLDVNRIIGYGAPNAGGIISQTVTNGTDLAATRLHPHTHITHSFTHSRSASSLIHSLLRPLPPINSCCLCRMSQQY